MTGLVEMVVESVRVHMLSNRHVVILKDSDGDRYLPIWIGPWEASAIAMRLQGLTPERPLTHDLFAAAIDALGVRIERIIIAALSEETFHARLVLARPEGEVEIDARPSDALALAVRTNARIYAAEGVLEQAALGADSVLGDDADDADDETADAGGSRRRGRTSLESFGDAVVDPRLDVFRDFVNSLDPDAGGGEGGRGRRGGGKRPD
jgi:bifunctional DNase/RNase